MLFDVYVVVNKDLLSYPCWQAKIIVKMCESWFHLDFSLTELLTRISKSVSTQMYYLSVSPKRHNSQS